MLERYRDVMNQIHMPDDCDWKIRSAMEKKARETHRRRPLRRISLAAAVVAILVTTALAATFLRSQTFQEMLGREAVQWEDQIQEGVLAELTMDHFRVQVVQSLFTTDSANVVLEITPLDAEGQARLADVDLLSDLSAFNRDHPDPLPDGGAISWDHWVLPDGTETCKRIGISVFTVNRPFVQGESFPLYLAMQDRPIPQTKEDTTQPTEAPEQSPEILAEGICMLDIPTVCTSARALTLDHEQVQEFAMTPFSITIRGVTVATISEGEETKLGAVQEMALLLQDGTEVPLIQGGVVQTCDQVNSWFHFAGPVGSNFQLTWRWSEVMDLSRVSGLQLDGQWYSFD